MTSTLYETMSLTKVDDGTASVSCVCAGCVCKLETANFKTAENYSTRGKGDKKKRTSLNSGTML